MTIKNELYKAFYASLLRNFYPPQNLPVKITKLFDKLTLIKSNNPQKIVKNICILVPTLMYITQIKQCHVHVRLTDHNYGIISHVKVFK